MRLKPSLGQTFEKSKFCKMAKPFKGFGITLKISCLLLFCSPADFASSLNLENNPAIVDPETLTDQVTTPSPSKNVDWNDWETWTPSPEISKAFPYYRMGYDNDGIVGEYFYKSPVILWGIKLYFSLLSLRLGFWKMGLSGLVGGKTGRVVEIL